MRVVFRLTDGTVSEELVFTDASFDVTWKHMQFPLSCSVTAPTQMNIIVNATHTENASDLGACSVCTSWDHNATMHVDNISFYYNNRLASISVDSVLINDYNPNVNTYTLTLPSEYVGIPNVSVVGEVPDQAYEYVWIGCENGVSTMTIK